MLRHITAILNTPRPLSASNQSDQIIDTRMTKGANTTFNDNLCNIRLIYLLPIILLLLATVMCYAFHESIDKSLSNIFFYNRSFFLAKDIFIHCFTIAIQSLVAIPMIFVGIYIIIASKKRQPDTLNDKILLALYGLIVHIAFVYTSKFIFQRSRPLDIDYFRPSLEYNICNQGSAQCAEQGKLDTRNPKDSLAYCAPASICNHNKDNDLTNIFLRFFDGASSNRSYSFLSSHTMYTAWLYTFGILYVPNLFSFVHLLLQIIVIIIALNMGILRIVVGKHYLSDILFSIAISFFIGFCIRYVYTRRSHIRAKALVDL